MLDIAAAVAVLCDVSEGTMLHEVAQHLRQGPTSPGGWVLAGVCFLALIVRVALELGYVDEALGGPSKPGLESHSRLLKANAPPRFVRSGRWLYPALVLGYVISVYI